MSLKQLNNNLKWKIFYPYSLIPLCFVSPNSFSLFICSFIVCVNCISNCILFFFRYAGKYRTAHKPHSKPKVSDAFEVDFLANGRDTKSVGRFQSEEELWARLEELERQEEILGELDRYGSAFRFGVQKATRCVCGCTQKICL